MSDRGAARLAALAAALLDARLASLKRRQADCAATAATIAALDAAQRRQVNVIAAELEAPVAGRVYDLWGSWVDRRRVALNMRLARERVAEANAVQDARVAFGRSEALRLISEDAAAAARTVARRRAARGLRG